MVVMFVTRRVALSEESAVGKVDQNADVTRYYVELSIRSRKGR